MKPFRALDQMNARTRTCRIAYALSSRTATAEASDPTLSGHGEARGEHTGERRISQLPFDLLLRLDHGRFHLQKVVLRDLARKEGLLHNAVGATTREIRSIHCILYLAIPTRWTTRRAQCVGRTLRTAGLQPTTDGGDVSSSNTLMLGMYLDEKMLKILVLTTRALSGGTDLVETGIGEAFEDAMAVVQI